MSPQQWRDGSPASSHRRSLSAGCLGDKGKYSLIGLGQAQGPRELPACLRHGSHLGLGLELDWQLRLSAWGSTEVSWHREITALLFEVQSCLRAVVSPVFNQSIASWQPPAPLLANVPPSLTPRHHIPFPLCFQLTQGCVEQFLCFTL